MQTVDHLADAALRRRVAEIDGVESDVPGYFTHEVTPDYPADANAALAAVQRWCERNGGVLGLEFRTHLGEWSCHIIWESGKCGVFKTVPASDPHAAARALCLALTKANDAVKLPK